MVLWLNKYLFKYVIEILNKKIEKCKKREKVKYLALKNDNQSSNKIIYIYIYYFFIYNQSLLSISYL